MKRLVSALCLILITFTLIAPAAGQDVFFILPLIGILLVIVVSLPALSIAEPDLVALDASLSSVSLRAPPQQ